MEKKLKTSKNNNKADRAIFRLSSIQKKKSWKSCEEADSRTAEIEWMNTNLAHLTRSCVGFYSHPFELFKS